MYIYHLYLWYCSITEPSTVFCDFTSSPTEVVTIVHHNSEQRIQNIGHHGPAAYKWNVSYFVPHTALPYIKEGANRCEQYIWFECYMVDMLLDAYLLNFLGEKVPYLVTPYGEANCSCLLRDRACDELGITG